MTINVAVVVGLAVGVLNQPPFLLLKEMMITPRMITRMAMMPIMVVGFIRISYGFGATSVSMPRALSREVITGRPFLIRTGT